MILVMLANIALALINAFVFLLPGGTPVEAFQSLHMLMVGARELNTVLPVSEMFTALSVLLTAVGALVFWRLVLFIYHEIPLNH